MTSKPEQPPTYLARDDDELIPPPLLPEDEEPPAYELENPLSPDDVLPPSTFAIRGRFIYSCPSSSSVGGGEISTEPAYQLSRDIHAQERASAGTTIEFERVDHKFKTSARSGNLTHTKRGKPLYNLEYHLPLLSMNWQALAKPTSRKTLGHVSLEKPSSLHRGYRAYKMLSEAQEAFLKKKTGSTPKRTCLFSFRQVDEEHAVWEWKDGEGKVIARQWRDHRSGGNRSGAADGKKAQDGGEEEYKLEVVVEVSRRVMDSLVALWCLWMWHLQIVGMQPKKTWGDRKATLEKKRPDLRGMAGGFLGM